MIVANLSVVVAFFFRIGTEETTAFSAGGVKSIVTFGSQPLRMRALRDPLQSTVGDIETTSVELNGAGEVRKEIRISGDTEAFPEMPAKPAPLADS